MTAMRRMQGPVQVAFVTFNAYGIDGTNLQLVGS